MEFDFKLFGLLHVGNDDDVQSGWVILGRILFFSCSSEAWILEMKETLQFLVMWESEGFL